ncbi:DUF3025 domain-containing protein [Bowmanella denitrificans]|uniref:DUF3025 domain-containing protein n=1 Tax=Bowmanella denitrificans TaxID=366582 RepID=UPI000C9BC2FD|nr:DUF3025 domain-containing protein [Bowmanella denitrificans]
MLDNRPKPAHCATNAIKNKPTARRFADSLPQQWMPEVFKYAPFSWLASLFALREIMNWPDYQWLNQDAKLSVAFVPQHCLDLQSLCYESFIATHSKVPTRQHNWHDFFNALIWRQFPLSKSALNRLHMADIKAHGTLQRTPRRNRITHFDECGVLLVYSDPVIAQLLKDHQWLEAFWQHRSSWGKQVQALIFGHANYEMLLNPYIGLTGKWLGIQVPACYFDWPQWEQLRWVDQHLQHRLAQENCLGEKGVLSPLPLLGVPGWWSDNQQADFYRNSDYFMPKRK